MNDPQKLELSPRMQAILAAVRRPPRPGLHSDAIAGLALGGSFNSWSELTLLVQAALPGGLGAAVDFVVHGYRVIGLDARQDECSASVSMPAGSEVSVVRLRFPDVAVKPGSECYYAAHLDFAGSTEGEIDHALFLVVDDQLTGHVLGGGVSPA